MKVISTDQTAYQTIKCVGEVDRADQMLAPHEAARKTLKWYRKILIHFLQVAMLNAYTLFQKANPTSKLRFVNFHVMAIKSMITSYNRAPASAAATDECITRLAEYLFRTHTIY